MALSLWALLSSGVLASEPLPPQPAQEAATAPGDTERRDAAELPPGLRCLKAAYPDTVCAVATDTLETCAGDRLVWDDGRRKPGLAEKIADPDLEDMMSMRYRPGRYYDIPPFEHDPGRLRPEPFFGAIYGRTRAEVRGSLRRVAWLPKSGGRRVLMSTVNGAADALERVSADIERELPRELRALAAKDSGTFNWRTIRGTNRRSLHSYGIAIDIGIKRSDYWRWNKPGPDGRYRYKNRFPLEIVEIFERHGFVWGGKWYHFDSMHFEYRPELLVEPCVLPPRAAPGTANRGGPK